MSSRLPIGVATTKSVPGIPWEDCLLYHWRIAMYSSEPLPHFVDDYLRYLQEVHPTIAALDGVHTHDDLLEDYRPDGDRGRTRAPWRVSPAGSSEIPQDGADPGRAGRAPDRRLATSRRGCSSSRRSAPGSGIRTSTPTSLASSLAAQALFAYAPETERARRVLSKLRQVAAADPGGPRQRQGSARHLRQGRHRDLARGRQAFIERDLPRAFADVDDLHLLGDLADASTEADAGDRHLRRAPRDASRRRARKRILPARARQVRAEAEARRGHHAAAPSGCSRSRSASSPRRRRSSATSPAA